MRAPVVVPARVCQGAAGAVRRPGLGQQRGQWVLLRGHSEPA